ncbi:unnamed protein product, partial [Mesorhabditis spiculigera]
MLQYPFFLIVRHLVIINNIHLIAQATLVLPLMVIVYTEETNGIFYLWSTIGTQVTKFTEEAVVYFTLLMAMNRLSIFVLPRFVVYFEGTKLRITIWTTWGFVLLHVGVRFLVSMIILGLPEYNDTLTRFRELLSTVNLQLVGLHHSLFRLFDLLPARLGATL